MRASIWRDKNERLRFRLRPDPEEEPRRYYHPSRSARFPMRGARYLLCLDMPTFVQVFRLDDEFELYLMEVGWRHPGFDRRRQRVWDEMKGFCEMYCPHLLQHFLVWEKRARVVYGQHIEWTPHLLERAKWERRNYWAHWNQGRKFGDWRRERDERLLRQKMEAIQWAIDEILGEESDEGL